MNGGQLGPKRSALRIALAALVVLVGVAGVVVALALALDHYPVQAAASSQPGNDRSSAVVAVITPIIAGVAGIVGLYFGISATGSARGQQVQTTADIARSATDAAKVAAQTSAQTAQAATDVAKSAAESTAQASQA